MWFSRHVYFVVALIAILCVAGWQFVNNKDKDFDNEYLQASLESQYNLGANFFADTQEIDPLIIEYWGEEGLQALRRYPEKTRQVFKWVGGYDLSRTVLDEMQHMHTIPLIYELAINPRLEDSISESTVAAYAATKDFFVGLVTEKQQIDDLSDTEKQQARALGIVQKLSERDHGFMNLYTFIATDTEPSGFVPKRRIGTSLTDVVTDVSFGNIFSLEDKVYSSEAEASDYAWAVADVALLVGGAAILKGARGGKFALKGSRTGSRLLKTGGTGLRGIGKGIGKIALNVGVKNAGKLAVVGVGVLAWKKPGLVFSAVKQFAKNAGWPITLVLMGTALFWAFGWVGIPLTILYWLCRTSWWGVSKSAWAVGSLANVVERANTKQQSLKTT